MKLCKDCEWHKSHDYYRTGSGYGDECLCLALKNEKTYFRQVVGTEHKYFDYDGDTYTPEQLQEKLNND